MKAIDYSEISPGVRRLVCALRDAGFETTDSGDGSNHAAGMGCALPFPMVAIRISPGRLASEADRLLKWTKANTTGLPEESTIEASYSPLDGETVVVMTHVADKHLRAPDTSTGGRDG